MQLFKTAMSLLNHTSEKNSGSVFFRCKPVGSVSMNFSVNVRTLSMLSGIEVTQHLQRIEAIAMQHDIVHHKFS